MGNNRLSSGCQFVCAADEYPTAHANGILGRVPGDYIAEALAALPPADGPGASHHEVVIDAGHAGTVRLFIERRQSRHGKNSRFFWSAYRAEPVDER